ncbi:MAG: acetyl-CoA C-acyltransferase [Planctomycetes bacterium]|nr:acetyl-CoA C-acyltransferase [Planctomycetota bacterium]
MSDDTPQRLAIIDAVRTPLCKAGGQLCAMQADDLGVIPVRELLARNVLAPEEIDEVIIGCVAQPAHAANIARVIALKAGLPDSCIASTVHRNCASGMESLSTAWERIKSGQADCIICGGTESMSNIPLMYGDEMTQFFSRMFRAKTLWKKLAVLSSFRPRFLKPVIGVQLGLTDPVSGLNMGQTAENLAREFHITREMQDLYALQSHQRAAAARENEILAEEIIPLPIAPQYRDYAAQDDGPRENQTLKALQKLRPYFDRHNGTVTVGNACPLTDGAAAMIVMSEERARERELPVLGYVRDYAYAGLSASRMGLGPVYATAQLFNNADYTMKDFDIIELNEAFAAQVLACEAAFASDAFAQEFLNRDQALGEIDRERLNMNGGAIALGHPVGTTGARMILTALHTLRRKNLNRALATLCIGGGQGAAFVLERE